MLKSSWKIWFVLMLIALPLMGTAYHFGERQGLLWTFIFCIFSFSLFYFFGDIRLSELFGGRFLEGQDPWGILSMTKELARSARIPLPEVIVIHLNTPTAFSIGRNWKNSKIYLSHSLINELQPEDLKAVLAHEIVKIKQQDTLILTMSSAFVGGIFIIKSIYKNQKPSSSSERSFTYYLRALWAPIMSFALRAVLSPQRIYENDKMTAQLLGDPKILAKTLWKLEAFCNTRPFYVPLPLAHLFIVNPLMGRKWFRHFLYQPKVENRITQLVGNYPI